MSTSTQFILDDSNNPVYAVLPYSEYLALCEAAEMSMEDNETATLLSKDCRYVTLPHAGPDFKMDLLQFLQLWLAKDWPLTMAINKRAQRLDQFDQATRISLDPILREYVVTPESPYANTMQATNDVTNALVATGMFTLSKQRLPQFYRPVNCITLDESKAVAFIKKHTA